VCEQKRTVNRVEVGANAGRKRAASVEKEEELQGKDREWDGKILCIASYVRKSVCPYFVKVTTGTFRRR